MKSRGPPAFHALQGDVGWPVAAATRPSGRGFVENSEIAVDARRSKRHRYQLAYTGTACALNSLPRLQCLKKIHRQIRL